MKDFTTEELRTLVWMCQTKAAQITLNDMGKGRKPSEDPAHQRILSISKKAYAELISRDNKEVSA